MACRSWSRSPQSHATKHLVCTPSRGESGRASVASCATFRPASNMRPPPRATPRGAFSETTRRLSESACRRPPAWCVPALAGSVDEGVDDRPGPAGARGPGPGAQSHSWIGCPWGARGSALHNLNMGIEHRFSPTHAHALTHARERARTHTRARAHTHTDTHTHTKYGTHGVSLVSSIDTKPPAARLGRKRGTAEFMGAAQDSGGDRALEHTYSFGRMRATRPVESGAGRERGLRSAGRLLLARRLYQATLTPPQRRVALGAA